ncbi:hypothetical protein [Meiothermus hypogaeus]|uniref:Uncharacterized protein n=2 Tax=Meiothermus hypogaeus TaxID=884155 RepID=A0A511QY09_9DEIN|nr:hypothetical protein [Meiothermus hypogaeus]RIH79817.1 hypothetical protein Mhypo_00902 [Meiothermus hypogaeus]GEM82270.1 hypothetical protein MHY01S_04360 [Meiothermus hypogaeus NBRC 106114]GIW36670.1 MAG: hypothetical protein KatS3mg073_0815 [Meiothermus sp.]
MEIPLPVYIIGLRGLLNLIALLLIGASLLNNLPLLVREPNPRQLRFFKFTAGFAVVAIGVELLVRTLFMGGVTWLHAVYGLLAASILWFVSGLGPGGWFRKSLEKAPEQVGPYFFWASLVGLLLWWRFIETGIALGPNP